MKRKSMSSLITVQSYDQYLQKSVKKQKVKFGRIFSKIFKNKQAARYFVEAHKKANTENTEYKSE